MGLSPLFTSSTIDHKASDMQNKFTPLTCASASTLILVGLFLYALYSDHTGSVFVPLRYLPGVAVSAAGVVGIGSSWKVAPRTPSAITYVIGTTTLLGGVASFYVFTAPTTINVFGFLAVVIGMLISVVSGLTLVFSAIRRSRHTGK